MNGTAAAALHHLLELLHCQLMSALHPPCNNTSLVLSKDAATLCASSLVMIELAKQSAQPLVGQERHGPTCHCVFPMP
ncbi:hypothetical protein COO60DRAFT_908438 [Scenedesmus sp. NREL 46B-D3]|nr:hypothetical protein COO60DRAFT_908438 [Scenedesmus sp. NREL 46B-D3]